MMAQWKEIAMFSEKTAKQYYSLDSACERFSARYVLSELAKQSGIQEQMLRNKLNPAQPHQLTVRDLVMLYQATHDESLIDGALLECGLTAVQLPDVKDDAQLLKRAIELNATVGGIGQQALRIAEMGRVTRTQRNMLVDAATSAMGDLVIFINEIESKFHTTPMLSHSA
jgi:hypothetical protein